MRRLFWLLLPLCVGPAARAEDARGPVLLLHRNFPAASIWDLQREATARGLEVSSPEPRSEPASETLLSDVRPLWRDMAWTRAAGRLDEAVEKLIRGREPTAAVVRALAEIELWRGACRLLAHDAPGAAEHFVLARTLWPAAQLEPIFPPKVRAAFKSARPARAVPVAVRLAPAGARLWLDGRQVGEGTVKAAPGLHYAVLTRSDMVPVAQVVRVPRAGAQISLSLREQAPPDEALRAARWWSPDPAVVESLKRPILVVALGEGHYKVAALQTMGSANEPLALDAADAAKAVARICEVAGGCTPVAPIVEPPVNPPNGNPIVVAPPVEPPPPVKPVWRRGWFWGVIGAGVVVVAGATIGGALGATAPRDYVVHVR